MRTRASIATFAAIGFAAAGVAGCGSSKYEAPGSGSGGGGSASTSAGGSSAGGSSGGGAGGSAYSYANAKYASGEGKEAVAAASSRATVVLSKSQKGLGTILDAGSKKLTLYLFEADSGGKSACKSSACVKAWPPLTSSGAPRAGAGVSRSALGTISRGKGVKQVTYHGHPLYYYAADSSAGDAFGQGVDSFGARWYVVSTSGSAVKK